MADTNAALEGIFKDRYQYYTLSELNKVGSKLLDKAQVFISTEPAKSQILLQEAWRVFLQHLKGC